MKIRRTDSENWERRTFEDGDAATAYLADAPSDRKHDWVDVREVRRDN